MCFSCEVHNALAQVFFSLLVFPCLHTYFSYCPSFSRPGSVICSLLSFYHEIPLHITIVSKIKRG
jgi:hypothetical protein